MAAIQQWWLSEGQGLRNTDGSNWDGSPLNIDDWDTPQPRYLYRDEFGGTGWLWDTAATEAEPGEYLDGGNPSDGPWRTGGSFGTLNGTTYELLGQYNFSPRYFLDTSGGMRLELTLTQKVPVPGPPHEMTGGGIYVLGLDSGIKMGLEYSATAGELVATIIDEVGEPATYAVAYSPSTSEEQWVLDVSTTTTRILVNSVQLLSVAHNTPALLPASSIQVVPHRYGYYDVGTDADVVASGTVSRAALWGARVGKLNYVPLHWLLGAGAASSVPALREFELDNLVFSSSRWQVDVPPFGYAYSRLNDSALAGFPNDSFNFGFNTEFRYDAGNRTILEVRTSGGTAWTLNTDRAPFPYDDTGRLITLYYYTGGEGLAAVSAIVVFAGAGPGSLYGTNTRDVHAVVTEDTLSIYFNNTLIGSAPNPYPVNSGPIVSVTMTQARNQVGYAEEESLVLYAWCDAL